MGRYISKRLLLAIPTLFGIMVLNFIIVQSAPGGPVDQMIAQMQGFHSTGNLSAGAELIGQSKNNRYGVSADLLKEIEQLYGFDKPASERFFIMIKSYLQFDFGDSFFRNASVLELMKEKLPVSISLGLWSTLLIYGISIPLGIKKAVKHGSAFDIWTSSFVTIGFAIPGFMLAIMLIVLFAGGSYWELFPLRGLSSNHFDQLSTWGKIKDYLWHITLPVLAYSIGGFAQLTMLTKNVFLEEIGKQYVVTARAKGLTEQAILYRHIFRNAMLIIIAGFPAAFIGLFFTGSLLIEVIFSIDGFGLLSFESIINRDYPVFFASLFIFTLIGLLLKLLSDICYVLIDPRIDFKQQM